MNSTLIQNYKHETILPRQKKDSLNNSQCKLMFKNAMYEHHRFTGITFHKRTCTSKSLCSFFQWIILDSTQCNVGTGRKLTDLYICRRVIHSHRSFSRYKCGSQQLQQHTPHSARRTRMLHFPSSSAYSPQECCTYSTSPWAYLRLPRR